MGFVKKKSFDDFDDEFDDFDCGCDCDCDCDFDDDDFDGELEEEIDISKALDIDGLDISGESDDVDFESFFNEINPTVNDVSLGSGFIDDADME